MTALAGAVVIVVAALIKGAIGFGFPLLATPLLALALDLRTAVAVLLLPNIVMDGIQVTRRGRPPASLVRRFGLLIGCGILGTVLGTRLLVLLPSPAATAVLGAFVILFVGINVTGFSLRVPPRWEPWLSPVVGAIAGTVGGLSNVPGTPLVLYLYALRLPKHEFVRTASLLFLAFKVIQLGVVASYGFFTWRVLGGSLVLTGVGLAGFAGGLRLQDGLDQRSFNRAVLAFLAGVGLWLLVRALR